LPVKNAPSRCCIERLSDATLCTEDGSAGFKGTVVDYVRRLPIDQIKDAVLFCCGPALMLKACHEFALEKASNATFLSNRSWRAA